LNKGVSVKILVVCFLMSSIVYAQQSNPRPADSTMSGGSDNTHNQTKEERAQMRMKAGSMGGAPNAGAGMGTGTGAGSTVGKKIKSEGVTAGSGSGVQQP
jgi:hypothetical protein